MSQTAPQAILTKLKERGLPQRTREGVAASAAGHQVAGLDFRNLIDVLAAVLEDGLVTADDYEAVADYMEDLYNTHIRDLDIPGVGPVIEGFVDDLLAKALRQIIRELFVKFAPDFTPPDDVPFGDDLLGGDTPAKTTRRKSKKQDPPAKGE